MQPPPNQLPDSPSAAHLPSFFASLNKTRSSQFRELLQTPPESSHTSQHGRSSKEEASYSFSHNKVPHPHIGLSTSKWPSRNSSQCDTLQPLLAQELFVHNKGRKITTASDRIMEAIEGLSDRVASVQHDVVMLKSDSRHNREQLHDMQLGQKLLPVRDEIADEIMNILTSVIQDTFQSSTLDNANRSIARNLTETFFPRLEAMICGLEKMIQASKTDVCMNLERSNNLLEHINCMSDVIKKLDDSLEAQRDGSRIFDDRKKSFERLIGTNMNANIHFIQNSLQELHAKVNQLSAPSRPPEYVELKKHATHLVASSASITSIVDLLRVILSNQTHLKMLVQHLLSTSNSNNSQNLSYQRDPLSSISQHLSLDHLNKALPNEALQDHTTSTQLLSTQSSTMQSNSTDDLPLTGNDSTDIFRSKSYIPGSVSFPCSTSLEEVTSLNPHSMSTMDQNKPSSSPGGVAATASSKTCTASTVESTTKICCKKGKFKKSKAITRSALTSTLECSTTCSIQKAIPCTSPAIGTTRSLINAQTHRRQTRQSSKKASHLSSYDVQSSVIPDCRGSVLQPFGPTERDIGIPVPTEGRVSKGKKRTWDFSSDEEAEET
ncbi:hypothetical protein J010_05884 [Cryptococcus neoformans]|nr:hypothetical protein C355_05827 [Cryptococcus neoformans var. grubii Th84]OXH02888.1 hypothetical protein J010_05884 [Cryptococcus neoformans var. grubii]OXH24676.1 hypothetical protein J009_05874 [Cryptococcus neoformans var. grubii]OXH44721.1 hypothetical protein J004_05923 [Cryptococcus neoformans var. grubii]OXH45438.1 hypothetical protein J003_05821 [Cryptococcus neoformans var. grubii]